MSSVRFMNFIICCVFVWRACCSAEDASGNSEACLAGEEICAGSGKSMIQIASSYTAKVSPKQESSEINMPRKVEYKCDRLRPESHSNQADLTNAGFLSVQSLCCATEMANFIDRLIRSHNHEVCNQGSLKGLASYYDCPGEFSFHDLNIEINTTSLSHTGDCAWIKSSGASSCPVMQPQCPDFPADPSTLLVAPTAIASPASPPSPPSPSNPTSPSDPTSPLSLSPPSPPAPTSSMPCPDLTTTTTIATTTTTTTTTTSTTTTVTTVAQFAEGQGACLDSTGNLYRRYVLVDGQHGFTGDVDSCKQICAARRAAYGAAGCYGITYVPSTNFCEINVDAGFVIANTGSTIQNPTSVATGPVGGRNQHTSLYCYQAYSHICYIDQCGCPSAFKQPWCTAESYTSMGWCWSNSANCEGNCNGKWCQAP